MPLTVKTTSSAVTIPSLKTVFLTPGIASVYNGFRRIFSVSVLVVLSFLPWTLTAQDAPVYQGILAIHGGAGNIRPEGLTAEAEQDLRNALTQALRAGYDLLKSGGSSLDAVTASITILEDSPLFNAGRGAVLTSAGTAELDASIMDGSKGTAGAVAGVTAAKNPILAARAVMEKSEHVLLAGKGADTFAEQMGLEIVPNAYFIIPERTRQLERLQKPAPVADSTRKFGTVGAVALDTAGNLAAGTSTGGMMNKRFGRVGDSPIIGAGTYARNETCAVSATGHGEYFIRGVVAYDIAARMRYRGETIGQAASNVVLRELVTAGGTGGVIAIDGRGNITMPFNTPGMYRGYIDAEGKVFIALFGAE